MKGLANEVEGSTLFATAFYHAKGRSPNAWTLSDRAKLDMYYRCMVVCYASLRRFHPEAQLGLFTNRELPEPFNAQLRSLNVVTRICGDRYTVDTAFTNGFPGCLLTLDVIAHLAENSSGEFKSLVMIDSDCVVRRKVDALLAALNDDVKVVHAYEPGYPVNMVANGQSRASLTLALSYSLQRVIEQPIPLYGGEFFAISAEMIPLLARRIERFWYWMRTEGVGTFGHELTEEHVMSIVLSEPGQTIRAADRYVKRLWTAVNYSTINGDEDDIAIWHLPSEKKKGFVTLYRYWIKNGGFDKLDDHAFRRLVDKAIPLAERKRAQGRIVYRRFRDAARVLLTGQL